MSKNYVGKIGILRSVVRKPHRNVFNAQCRISDSIGSTAGSWIRGRKLLYLLERADQTTFRMRKSNAPKTKKIPQPEAIRFQPFHIIDTNNVNKIGVSITHYPLSDISIRAVGEGMLEFEIPKDMPFKKKVGQHSQPGRKRKSGDDVEKVDFRDIQRTYRGAAYAVALNANRLGAKVNPVGVGQLLDMLRNCGHRIEQLSPRLWRLDGATATLSDLIERSRRMDHHLTLIAGAA